MNARPMEIRGAMLAMIAIALLGVSAVAANAGDHGYRYVQHRSAHAFPVGRPINVHGNFDSRRSMRFAGGQRNGFERRDDRRMQRFGHDNGFAGNFGYRRAYPLQSIDRQGYVSGGNSITIFNSGDQNASSQGNYAGSNSVYFSDGGTYVTGYGYGGARARSVDQPRPRAKVIDVATMGDVCSHEAGVCVIRP